MKEPYYKDEFCTIYHGDCRDILPHLGKVDLVVTDPPYGIKAGDQRQQKSRTKQFPARNYGVNDWDKAPVEQELIDSLLIISTYQVIWGGNYYRMPPCKGPLVWDKQNTGNFADGEIAWNNYGIALRIKQHRWNGMIREDNEPRYHITQKPLKVISWAISLCPKKPLTILDPFMGSGTTLRAAKNCGIQSIGIELSKRDCDIAVDRLTQEVLGL